MNKKGEKRRDRLIMSKIAFKAVRREKKLSKEEVQRIKTTYPLGTKLKVLSIDDPYISLPVGIMGEVTSVDDNGRIYISLNNKRVVTIDSFKDKIVTVRKGGSNRRNIV